MKTKNQDNSNTSNMKASFRKAFKVFKYLLLIFTLLYWVGVIIDDWSFIEKYWESNKYEYLGIWMAYFLAFSFALSFYFWVIVSIVIFVYHKIIQPRMKKKDE